MPSPQHSGPERRASERPAAVERREIAMRLLITTERLERLASRLEAFVSTPARPAQKDAPT